MSRRSTVSAVGILIALGVIVLVLVLLAFGSQHAYFLTRVDQDEVGVRFRGGRIYEIVGPGVYSDFALYANLKKVSSAGVFFDVEDAEVITKDRQRVGLKVSGYVFRPNYSEMATLQSLWPSYSTIYLNDSALIAAVENLTLQAMKSCVGDRTFNDNVIGSARDELRLCIDGELDQLVSELGLTVKNVTVPNVILSAEVQASLDAITKSRLDTELAQQDALKATQQAAADQAREEGAVRVQLARQQEEVRQKTQLAKLEQERLVAERAVIEAQKANDLLAAQKDLEINRVQAEAALESARAQLAAEIVRAELYDQNSAYAYLQALLANASALRETDKIIFTQEGSMPTIVIPGPGIMPTVETAPPVTPPSP